jgi:hypothetical protein
MLPCEVRCSTCRATINSIDGPDHCSVVLLFCRAILSWVGQPIAW